MINDRIWIIDNDNKHFFLIDYGVVLEETIIMLPHNIYTVFLSATIPNAKDFADWISKIHCQVSISSL